MSATADVPKFVSAFGPLLQALIRVGGSAHKNAVIQEVAYLVPSEFDEIAKTERINNSSFRNNVYWARVYLSSAGYVEYTRRGVWSITDAGRAHADMTREEAVELFFNTVPKKHIYEQ